MSLALGHQGQILHWFEIFSLKQNWSLPNVQSCLVSIICYSQTVLFFSCVSIVSCEAFWMSLHTHFSHLFRTSISHRNFTTWCSAHKILYSFSSKTFKFVPFFQLGGTLRVFIQSFHVNKSRNFPGVRVGANISLSVAKKRIGGKLFRNGVFQVSYETQMDNKKTDIYFLRKLRENIFLKTPFHSHFFLSLLKQECNNSKKSETLW